jgi:multicomponent Na+:H+ antiporter subunit G
MSVVADVAAATCFLLGSFLALVAGIGLVRFPDLLARMHAATKPQVLGLILMVLGLAIELRSAPVLGTLLLVIMFQLITAPVAAHMVGRAGYRTGKIRSDLLVRDELTADRESAERRRQRAADAEGAVEGSPSGATHEPPEGASGGSAGGTT